MSKECPPGLRWYAGACRTEEAIERRREKDKIRNKKRYTDPVTAKKISEQKKLKYRQNLEKERERSRQYYYENKEVMNEKRVQRSRDNQHRTNEIARANYHANREDRLKKEYERRDKRNPSRIIRRACDAFAKNSIGLDEFAERVSESVERNNEIMRKRRRHSKS